MLLEPWPIDMGMSFFWFFFYLFCLGCLFTFRLCVQEPWRRTAANTSTASRRGHMMNGRTNDNQGLRCFLSQALSMFFYLSFFFFTNNLWLDYIYRSISTTAIISDYHQHQHRLRQPNINCLFNYDKPEWWLKGNPYIWPCEYFHSSPAFAFFLTDTLRFWHTIFHK